MQPHCSKHRFPLLTAVAAALAMGAFASHGHAQTPRPEPTPETRTQEKSPPDEHTTRQPEQRDSDASQDAARQRNDSAQPTQPDPISKQAGSTWERPDGQQDGNERHFIEQALASGRSEVAAARLAKEQASSADVKAFAEELERNHTQLNQHLVSLQSTQSKPSTQSSQSMQSSGSTPVQTGPMKREEFAGSATPDRMAEQQRVGPPSVTGDEHEGEAHHAGQQGFHHPSLQALSGKQGREFDRAFVNWQIDHHQAALRRFEAAAEGSSDNASGASALARDALPSLRRHAARAESLARELASN